MGYAFFGKRPAPEIPLPNAFHTASQREWT